MPMLIKVRQLIDKNIINKNYLLQLLDGVILDISNKVRIKNDKELISYSYQVAGTVGLMMSQILNVTEKVAYKYAIDLGIAFQLTNIARDILDDAKINRVYIPSSWYKLNIKEIVSTNYKNKEKLKNATRDLLDLADVYYASAIKGLAFLSIRNRFAIFLALSIYRQIGKKIIRKGYSNLNIRESVSLIEKIFCFVKCLFLFLFNFYIHKKKYKHNTILHKHLKNI